MEFNRIQWILMESGLIWVYFKFQDVSSIATFATYLLCQHFNMLLPSGGSSLGH